MPGPAIRLHLPQPCAESWAAMTPTPGGRHCAACARTVVDFTQKTDAEIFAYLAAATGETCGRLRNDQLNRSLLPARPGHPAARWRAWLALALAAWGLRASPAAASGRAAAGPPTAAHPRRKPGPRHHPASPAPRQLRGTVRDAATHEPLAGVAIFLKDEAYSATTDSAGRFSLRLPPPPPRARRALVLHYAGYQSATVGLPAAAGAALSLELQPDLVAAGATIVGYAVQTRQDVTGGLVVVTTSEALPSEELRARQVRSFWQRITQPFRHQ